MTSTFNSDPSSNRPSNGSEHQSTQGIMLAHLFHQTNSLGQLHGKIDGIDKRVVENSRRISKLEDERPKIKATDLLTWLPGLLALAPWVLAALGKISWHDAVNSSTTGSGH